MFTALEYLIMINEGCTQDIPPSNWIEHPAHYNAGKTEVIDFIEEQALGFHLGNVIKYLCRSAHKGTPLQDLNKARWYLDREIARRSKL